MSSFLPEFTAFAVIHLLSLISPGPDFAMVVGSSLRYTRKAALLVALGIATGEIIHVSYSIMGLGYILHQSPQLLSVLKLLSGGYLIYIGVRSLQAKPASVVLKTEAVDAVGDKLGAWQAFRRGFFTNALNVKAGFFTLSIFTVIVSPQTSLALKLFYGFFISATTFLWFALVAFFLTSDTLQKRLLSRKHWIERFTGAVLVILGLRLAILG
jgi:threonine/homoserine/homoserine lactone efflux protein